MRNKKGFGILEILMVMVILTILYTYASNQGNAKYQSSKDIAEVHWLTNLLPTSIFYARQAGGRDPATKKLILNLSGLTKDNLIDSGVSVKTSAGNGWGVCTSTVDEEMCIEITSSGSKIDRLRGLVDDINYSYIDKSKTERVTFTTLKIIYNFAP